MERICAGIQHIVVLKNLDKYVTEYSEGQDTGGNPIIVKTENELRQYRCVLTNLETGVTVVAPLDAKHSKTLMDGGVYYVSFIFTKEQTEKVGVGKVSMSIVDSNDTVIYYNKHYARVFKTPLSQTE